MPKVSVVIPTHNRPELLKRAVASVQAQTYQDFELIVIEDADSRGGGWARNQGIKKATGEWVAFLDDDDQWLPEKLEVQMKLLEAAPPDVGFSFHPVINVFDDGEIASKTFEGVADYHQKSLESFNKFLTITLIIKRSILKQAGYFDEQLPSHQEAELMIRVTALCRGVGAREPLVRANMKSDHRQLGKNIPRLIQGREMILAKHEEEFKKYPKSLALHYFQLGLFYRDNRQFVEAKKTFKRGLKTSLTIRYALHYLYMFFYCIL